MEGRTFVRLPSDDGHSDSHSLDSGEQHPPFLSSSVPTQSSISHHYHHSLLASSDISQQSAHSHHAHSMQHTHYPQKLPKSKVKIDIKALDFGLLRWTRSIRNKMQTRRRRKLRSAMYGRKDVVASVFDTSHSNFRPNNAMSDDTIRTLDHTPPMTEKQFNEIFESVCTAITSNVQPRMNKFGSSGSYFARDINGHTVAIFKPKDEEPYGRLNPKYTKWFHRHFLAPFIGFGRACLIPNLSYQSEAAASVLDRLLQTHIVPRTQVVTLSSPSFFYDWIDRRASRFKKKPFPPKQGSFQVFLKGYQDASEFLRQHPWPGRPPSDTYNPSPHRQGHNLSKIRRGCLLLCGKAEDFDSDDSASLLSPENASSITTGGEYTTPSSSTSSTPTPRRGQQEQKQRQSQQSQQQEQQQESSCMESDKFRWTAELMLDFREQLEKLIILDFLMRNTDRGLDNFMIRACKGNCGDINNRSKATKNNGKAPEILSSAATSMTIMPIDEKPHIHVAAIDNSLAFPHQHPKGWRNYTYGWLWLPISLIGHPFSENTRKHFLPLLSSPQWWSQTTYELHKQFSTDRDFSEKMFRKQMAVLKGQGWNVVEALKHNDEGPLELCRRRKVLIWDDEIEVPLNFAVRNKRSGTTSPLSLDAGKQKRKSLNRNDNNTSSHRNKNNGRANANRRYNRKRPGLSQSLTLTFPVSQQENQLVAKPADKALSFSTSPKRDDYMSMSYSTPKTSPYHNRNSSLFLPSSSFSSSVRRGGGGLVSRPLSTAREVDLDNAKIAGVTGIAMLEHMEGRQREEGPQDYEELVFAGHGNYEICCIDDDDGGGNNESLSSTKRPKLPPKTRSNSSSISTSLKSVASSDYEPSTDVYVRGGSRSGKRRWNSSSSKQWGWRAQATRDGRVVIVPYLAPSLFSGSSFASAKKDSAYKNKKDRDQEENDYQREEDNQTKNSLGHQGTSNITQDENVNHFSSDDGEDFDDDEETNDEEYGDGDSGDDNGNDNGKDNGDQVVYDDDGEARSATSIIASEDDQLLSEEHYQTKIVIVERLEEIIANPTFTYC